MKKRNNIAYIIVTVTIILAALTGCYSNDENILWAQNLKADDIVKLEAVRMPSVENERYKHYDPAEFPRIVEIINAAKGRKIDNPESITGGGIVFYITMNDGTRHKFANEGNLRFIIDGAYYGAEYEWLLSWGGEALDSKVPDEFEY